jgi:LytS/YehU family sensor histidine kinase
VLLTVVQLSIETYLGWLRHAHELSFRGALRHYFSQHTQLSLLTYWALVAAVQFYRMYDQTRKRQIQAAQLEARLAEAQLDVLRMQLQPHFLFNTLQAATMLVHEDPDGAEDILLRLSELLRVSLDELHVKEIPLAREIACLDHYIGIQQRRFGDRLRFRLKIEEDVLACAVPSFVLQPLVENAVRHGIGKHKESDEVTVRAFHNAGHLHLEVHNATSTLTSPLEQLLAHGTGLANTQARLRQLYNDQQSLELFNLHPKGVCVALVFPLRPSRQQRLQVVESPA